MKLLIADDHTLFRDALVQYVERAEAGAKIALAEDFDGAVAVLRDDPGQNLVLLDLRMPGMNGMEGFRHMKEHFPDVPVALMSGLAEPEDVQAAIELGAVGYFPKTMSGKSLLKAIQQVLAGEPYLPLQEDGGFMPSYRDGGYRPAAASATDAMDGVNLTPRERDVLACLATGAPNKEIARQLGLQPVTVKLHVRGICRKLGVGNRTQAALKAQAMGIVPALPGSGDAEGRP